MSTISDLRRSLEDTAHSHDVPDPGQLLRAVQDDICTGRDKGSRTPRLVAAAAAIALVAGGGWALSHGLGDEETGSLEPAEPAWELVDGAPPEYAEGLALVDTVELDADSSAGVLHWAGSGQGYALAWCNVEPSRSPGVMVMLAPETGSSASPEAATVGCLDARGQAPGTPAAVPNLGNGQGLDAEVIAAQGAPPGGLQDDDAVVIGLYREAALAEFPYPDQQPAPDPPVHEVVIDAKSPMTNQAEIAHLSEAGAGVMLPAASAVSHPGTVLTTWAGEPGRLLVAVNGTVITNDGEGLAQPAGAGRWQEADPDLRRGYWHSWTAGASTREFDLSPTGLAAHGIPVQDGDRVEIAVSGAFPHDAWQVGVDQPAGAPPAATLDAVGPNEVLPQFAYGYQQVTAVSVPADGASHEVDLGQVDPSRVVWVAQCPESMLLTQVRVGAATTQCNPDVEWLMAIQDPELVVGEPVSVAVGMGSDPVTIAAYTPREWDGYPFANSADPISDSSAADWFLPEPTQGQPPPEMAEWAGPGPKALYREVARIGSADLDDDGRAQVNVPSSTDLSIWVETKGMSRVRMEVDGTPFEELLQAPSQSHPDGVLGDYELLTRDGWYSTWGTGTTGRQIRFDRGSALTGNGERDHPTVSVEVDAADGASVELVFYEFVSEDEWQV